MRSPATLRKQSGQALVLLAICIVVLAAMVGLVVDGGTAQSQKLVSQSAADGAALAAGYNLQSGSSPTFATATLAANRIIASDGLPAASLALTYLRSDHSTPATTPINTKYVEATVRLTNPTFFVRVLGIGTISLSSHAEATLSDIRGTCVICLMAPTGNSAHFNRSDTMTLSGGSLYVNSSSNQALKVDGNGTTITAPGIYITGGWQEAPMNTVTPTPLTGTPRIQDPDAAAPYPSLSNHLAYGGGTTTLNPGIYNGISIASGDVVNLNAGTYVLTGNLTLNGTLNAAGVTLFLACSTYPIPCASSGQPGAAVVKPAGSLTLTPPTSGIYKGMSVFADRNNISTNELEQGTNETVTGTWYTIRMPFSIIYPITTISVGNFIVDSFDLVQQTTFNINYDPATSYFPPGGPPPLVRLTLSR